MVCLSCFKISIEYDIKNAAIEVGILNKEAIFVGLRPGTVDTDLSNHFKAMLLTADFLRLNV